MASRADDSFRGEASRRPRARLESSLYTSWEEGLNCRQTRAGNGGGRSYRRARQRSHRVYGAPWSGTPLPCNEWMSATRYAYNSAWGRRANNWREIRIVEEGGYLDANFSTSSRSLQIWFRLADLATRPGNEESITWIGSQSCAC